MWSGEVRLRDGRGRPSVTLAVGDRVAPVSAPRDDEQPRTARVSYAEASRVLLRDSILDGMRDLLGERDWSSITLTDVAKAAGISRQTIYNEFGSRQGLAEGYALRLADRLVDAVDKAIDGNVGNVHAAFLEGFRAFFAESAADPLVISLLTGVAKPDLLQIITTDSAPIITRASERLTATFMHSWVRASEEDAGVLARAIVRLAMSYVSMPPEATHDVARDLARLMAPFAERYGVVIDEGSN
ncbi:TetR/AcrR family transcriptional regulator [Mycolicibacterium grossiae]|nr:TetR/AcrR family transcriptional regulator [Mycolicibacterium grossiae]